jgi:hypothetical protein
MIADGPGARARAELCEDPDRLDIVIAKAADCSRTTVLRCRRQLADLGVIPEREPGLSDDAWRPWPRRGESGEDGPYQRALLEVGLDPHASNQRLAERTRAGRTTVRLARHYLEQQGTIPVIPASERERREPAPRPPRPPQLPARPPELRQGLCATGEHDPSWWTSRNHAGKAIEVCGACPVRLACLEYALQLPVRTPGIWAGLSHHARLQLRKIRQGGEAGAVLPATTRGMPGQARCSSCGRELSGPNLLVMNRARGPYRACRWCRRESDRRSWERRKQRETQAAIAAGQ